MLNADFDYVWLAETIVWRAGVYRAESASTSPPIQQLGHIEEIVAPVEPQTAPAKNKLKTKPKKRVLK